MIMIMAMSMVVEVMIMMMSVTRKHDCNNPQCLRSLTGKAKRLGLWNMFLPVDSAAAAGVHGALGGGFTNRQCVLRFAPCNRLI